MLSCILICASMSANDLPFEDDDTVRQTQSQPTQSPTIIPWASIFGMQEIVVAFIFLMYLIVYIRGKASIHKLKSLTTDRFFSGLQKHFAVVPQQLAQYSLSLFDQISTGRYCHLMVRNVLRLTKRCDILGMLWDQIRHHKSLLQMEFLINPQKDISGFFYYGSHAPPFSKQLAVSDVSIESQNHICVSDMNESAKKFVNILDRFDNDNPGVISFVEISDTNRFDLRLDGNFVCRIELVIDETNPERTLNENVADFAVSLADAFATLVMPRDLVIQNQNKRNSIVSDLQKAKQE